MNTTEFAEKVRDVQKRMRQAEVTWLANPTEENFKLACIVWDEAEELGLEVH